MKDSLVISEKFYSIQGEGQTMGVPSVFVRLAGCNILCQSDSWTCDSIEVWKKGTKTPFEEVLTEEEVDKLKSGAHLIFTGGEPLLQDNISKFMLRQLPKFKEVQVESNGILATDVPDGITLVCSPKCMEKNGMAVKYLAPSKTILERADCLKFVMSADRDSPYNEVPQWALDWKANTGKEIYVSPMNVYNDFPQKIKMLRSEKQGNITLQERSTVDEVINFFEPGLLNMDKISKNHAYVGQYCMQHGLRMNMQMHLFANLA